MINLRDAYKEHDIILIRSGLSFNPNLCYVSMHSRIITGRRTQTPDPVCHVIGASIYIREVFAFKPSETLHR